MINCNIFHIKFYERTCIKYIVLGNTAGSRIAKIITVSQWIETNCVFYRLLRKISRPQHSSKCHYYNFTIGCDIDWMCIRHSWIIANKLKIESRNLRILFITKRFSNQSFQRNNCFISVKLAIHFLKFYIDII